MERTQRNNFRTKMYLLEDVPKMVNQFEKKNKITFYDSKNKISKKISKKISYGKIEED